MTYYSDLFDGVETKGDIVVRGVPNGSRMIITSDQQVPFQDDALLDTIYGAFAKDFKPKTPGAEYHHAIAGDGLDLFGLSSFPMMVSPNGYRVGMEIGEMRTRLARWGKKFDRNYYVFGNHEYRWARAMFEGRLAAYTTPLDEALGLVDLGYEWVPYGRHVDFEGFIITHGNSTAKHAASVELATYNRPGTSGHTNRPQTFTSASAADGEPITWFSLGMTCRTDMGAVIKSWSRTQSWQQGFGYGEVQDNVLHFQTARVHHDSFMAAGRVYKVGQ